MPPTTRSNTHLLPSNGNDGPSFDAEAYPHLVDIVLAHFARQELIVFRSVSRSYRLHVDRLLLRHLIVRSPGQIDLDEHNYGSWFGSEYPMAIKLAKYHGPALPWRAVKYPKASAQSPQNLNHLSQIRNHCRVLDVEWTSTFQTSHLNFAALRTLSNLHTLRRLAETSFTFDVDTIIDFAGVGHSYKPLQVKCRRYVGSGLGYRGVKTTFTTDKIRPAGLEGLKEVVLLFIEEHLPIDFVNHFLVQYQGMFQYTKFTIVGLVLQAHLIVDNVGRATGLGSVPERGADMWPYFKTYFLPSFSVPFEEVLSAVTFMSHDEYRESVGEAQYLLETQKKACFM